MDAKLNISFGALLAELEHYQTFFRKRIEIEQQYSESLEKLAIRQEELDKDVFRGVTSLVRSAWSDVRKDTSRIAQEHQSTADSLQVLYDNLLAFRVSKEKLAKRCKEQLRTATTEHTDYKATVARLQKNYHRACDTAQSLQQNDTPAANDGHSSDGSSSQVSSPPMRTRDLITGATAANLRDPLLPYPPGGSKARVAAQDAIKTSRNQLTNLMHRLGGDDARPTPPQNQHNEQVMVNGSMGKVLKAKREAESADVEYRRAVYQIETLRMQRERVQKAVSTNVLELVADLGQTMKDSLEQYSLILKANANLVSSILDDSNASITCIRPAVDAGQYATKFPSETTVDQIVYYENYFVGRCASLVFGVNLDAYSTSFEPPRPVPRLVIQCIEQIESRDLASPKAEGLYRVSAKMAAVQKEVLAMEKDEDAFTFDPSTDVHTIAAILKLYLRQLPVPLFAFAPIDRVALSKSLLGDEEERDQALFALTKRMNRLSRAHKATILAVLAHLSRLATHHEATSFMNASNLGLCFAPCFFGIDEETMPDPSIKPVDKDIIAETLILEYNFLANQIDVEFDPVQSRSRSSSGIGFGVSKAKMRFEEEFPLRRPTSTVSQTPSDIGEVTNDPMKSPGILPPGAAPRTLDQPARDRDKSEEEAFVLYEAYAREGETSPERSKQ